MIQIPVAFFFSYNAWDSVAFVTEWQTTRYCVRYSDSFCSCYVNFYAYPTENGSCKIFCILIAMSDTFLRCFTIL